MYLHFKMIAYYVQYLLLFSQYRGEKQSEEKGERRKNVARGEKGRGERYEGEGRGKKKMEEGGMDVQRKRCLIGCHGLYFQSTTKVLVPKSWSSTSLGW